MRHWLYGPARNSGVQGVKMVGGYAPRIAGRPLSVVHEIPLPKELTIPLERHGIRYQPVAQDGDNIEFGHPLAQASVIGGTISLPAPASGRVSVQQGNDVDAAQVTLLPTAADKPADTGKRLEAQRATPGDIRSALAEGGVWPFFWSSVTGRLPALDDSERPKAIIVNCITAEPFRTRGKVILRRSWDRIVQGIRFLPRLMADYGTIEVILTGSHNTGGSLKSCAKTISVARS